MTDYPEGAQILSSPPPAHPLYGKYPGRLLILADGTEVLMDKGLIPEGLLAEALPFGGREAIEASDAN